MDRFVRCTCDCKLKPKHMPLTLKMGLFYLICGLALYGFRGGFRKVFTRTGAGAAILRMIAALSIGILLVAWGSLEWAGAVKPFMQKTGDNVFQGAPCNDLRPR
jgi:hypothetical protein